MADETIQAPADPSVDVDAADANPVEPIPGDFGPGEVMADPSAPLDAGAPDAAAPAAPIEDLFESMVSPPLDASADMLAAGGPIVLPLLAMSVFAASLVLAKLWQFARARAGRRSGVEALLAQARAGDWSGALSRARRLGGVWREPMTVAVEGRLDSQNEVRLRETAYLAALGGIEALRGWMRPLEVMATLSPLLGLFGTVLGMIEAFAALEAAGSNVDPAILSGGIWAALLTTAVGLAVAIPTVAAVNWFERRIERHEHAVEQALGRLFALAPPQTARKDAPAHDVRPIATVGA